jgi:hypothetical protein
MATLRTILIRITIRLSFAGRLRGRSVARIFGVMVR